MSAAHLLIITAAVWFSMTSTADPPQHPRITRQPRNSNPNMIVDPDQLFLVCG